jgi:hypothetical protein
LAKPTTDMEARAGGIVYGAVASALPVTQQL